MRELGRLLGRDRYQSSHWDKAITQYREIFRTRWTVDGNAAVAAKVVFLGWLICHFLTRLRVCWQVRAQLAALALPPAGDDVCLRHSSSILVSHCRFCLGACARPACGRRDSSAPRLARVCGLLHRRPLALLRGDHAAHPRRRQLGEDRPAAPAPQPLCSQVAQIYFFFSLCFVCLQANSTFFCLFCFAEGMAGTSTSTKCWLARNPLEMETAPSSGTGAFHCCFASVWALLHPTLHPPRP